MRLLTIAVGIISLALFFSVFISPEYFSYVGLLPFFIPIFWLVNLFLFVIALLSWRKTALLPLLVLLIGFKFISITFQLNPIIEDKEGLKVLTYNAHLFNYYKNFEGKFESNIYTWLQEHPSDIQVYQEFYSDKTSPSRNSVKLLGEDKGFEVSYEVIDGNPDKRFFGLAIFSRYPIINEGKVFDNKRTNGAIFADIVYLNDTVRIYNAHLESMQINSEGLENLDGVKENYRQTLGKLQRGSVARSNQLKILLEHIEFSPYPVILMGDLNEIPYSYTYFKLSEDMDNAFEKAGRGFGFTYNRILFFLRIDHIFATPSLRPVQFKTHREVDYSDHYPVSATFTLD